METCDELILPGFEETLQSSQQAFPANQPPLPGSDEALKMTVGSGRQCSMLLAQSSPLGAFSKILLESSHFTNSEEFCYVWRVLDTRLGCSAFQLTQLGQSIGDNGCSLYATPQASQNGPNGQCPSLPAQIAKLWRTPNASDVTGAPMNLAIAAKLWPTPHAADGTGGGSPIRHDPNVTGGRSNLRDAVNPTSSGSLNPRFVEELMGFPIDHTALKRSVTRSCRSKPIRSSALCGKSYGKGVKVNLVYE